MSKQKVLRIYADGVFDSFHIGHANMFKQCRQAFPGQRVWLLGGVCDQKDIEQHKGPTISTQQQRIDMVRQCKWIDEVIEHAPWIITEEFLQKNKIDFVCHDDVPYVTTGTEDAYYTCKKLGKFKATQRTKGVSTTDIVAKILRNKNIYYVRNLRRGVSREKLGLSWARYLRLKTEMLFCPQRFQNPKKE